MLLFYGSVFPSLSTVFLCGCGREDRGLRSHLIEFSFPTLPKQNQKITPTSTRRHLRLRQTRQERAHDTLASTSAPRAFLSHRVRGRKQKERKQVVQIGFFAVSPPTLPSCSPDANVLEAISSALARSKSKNKRKITSERETEPSRIFASRRAFLSSSLSYLSHTHTLSFSVYQRARERER